MQVQELDPTVLDPQMLAQFIIDHDLSDTQLEELAGFLQSGAYQNYANYTHVPVGVREFILDPYYLDLKDEIYPVVLEEMTKMNDGTFVEICFTGAIGTAKTTMALWTTAYQLYLLSCMIDPHKTFGLDRSSEILIIFQSLNEKLAKALDYARFKVLIERSPYFKEHFPYDRTILSELKFPNRIIVRPVSGAATAAIGQNVIGGIIDELNYMSVIENSKNAIDGGTYDQAISVYNSIARRRKSRFMQQGKLPGILCLVSSKRYPGQFTDQKEEEAKTDKTIYVYDKRVWDIKPEAFVGEWFHVFIGDEGRKPRILEVGETVDPDDRHLVMAIPVEYTKEFETDIINSLREIAGVSTLARFPFILDTETITNAMKTNVDSVFGSESVDFQKTRLILKVKNIIRPDEPRFVHIDLGLTSDSAGLVVGHVEKFKTFDRGDMLETLPIIHIDGVLEIPPPKGGEIQFQKIRQTLTKLRELGMYIKWITYDSWQSQDSLQLLRQQGFLTGIQSIDTTMMPYLFTKTALYDGRVHLPYHSRLKIELSSLEVIAKKGKVDHPPNGSKDCADALAGVVYGLSTRRELWHRHGVPLNSIPQSVKDAASKTKRLNQAEAEQVGSSAA